MGMMIRHNRGRKAPALPKQAEKKVEPKVEVKAEPKEETTSSLDFTKDDIEKMNYLKLKSLAKKNDIETEDKEAKDIRAELIEKLGL